MGFKQNFTEALDKAIPHEKRQDLWDTAGRVFIRYTGMAFAGISLFEGRVDKAIFYMLAITFFELWNIFNLLKYEGFKREDKQGEK